MAGRARSLIGVERSAAMLDEARAAGIDSRQVQTNLLSPKPGIVHDLALVANVRIDVDASERPLPACAACSSAVAISPLVKRADDEDDNPSQR